MLFLQESTHRREISFREQTGVCKPPMSQKTLSRGTALGQWPAAGLAEGWRVLLLRLH